MKRNKDNIVSNYNKGVRKNKSFIYVIFVELIVIVVLGTILFNQSKSTLIPLVEARDYMSVSKIANQLRDNKIDFRITKNEIQVRSNDYVKAFTIILETDINMGDYKWSDVFKSENTDSKLLGIQHIEYASSRSLEYGLCSFDWIDEAFIKINNFQTDQSENKEKTSVILVVSINENIKPEEEDIIYLRKYISRAVKNLDENDILIYDQSSNLISY